MSEKEAQSKQDGWAGGVPVSSILSLLLILGMVVGFAAILTVFRQNPQSLPISIADSTALQIQPSPIAIVPVQLEDTGVIVDVVVEEEEPVEVLANDEVILTVISTNGAEEVVPPQSLNYDPANRAEIPTYPMQVPLDNAPVTVYLAGTVGCATCAIEAQYLTQIEATLANPNLEIIFVDIYPVGGAEGLAWFSFVIGAPDLTWTLDNDGTFRSNYAAALDTTIIMDQDGDILFRDDILTSFETLQAQIELALPLAN